MSWGRYNSRKMRIFNRTKIVIPLMVSFLYCMLIQDVSAQRNSYDIRKIMLLDRRNDNRMDIVFIGHDVSDSDPQNTQILFLQNIGNGNFSPPRKFEQQLRRPINLFKGRVDSDPFEDVIVITRSVASENGGIFVSRNSGGHFTRFERLDEHLQNSSIRTGVMFDIDRDGRDDIIGVVNADGRFSEPSTFLWSKNLGTGIRGAFSPWQKLDIKGEKMNPDMTLYELAFSNYGGELIPDALCLMLSTKPGNRYSKDDFRGLSVAIQEGFMRFLPMYFTVDLSGGITQAFGYTEDVDIGELFPGRKGVFLLFRQDLSQDGTSSGDRIDFVLKRDAGTRGYKHKGRFFEERPLTVFENEHPVPGKK